MFLLNDSSPDYGSYFPTSCEYLVIFNWMLDIVNAVMLSIGILLSSFKGVLSFVLAA